VDRDTNFAPGGLGSPSYFAAAPPVKGGNRIAKFSIIVS
jgi:hypothetical protein